MIEQSDLPVEVLKKMLREKLDEAERVLEEARCLTIAWQPVVDSCRAGLEVLDQPVPDASYATKSY